MTRSGPSGGATRASCASGTAAPPGRPADSRRGPAKFRPPTMRLERRRAALPARPRSRAAPSRSSSLRTCRGRQDDHAGAVGGGRRAPRRLGAARAGRRRPGRAPPAARPGPRRRRGRRPGVRGSLALPVPPVRERVLPLLDEALAAATPFLLVLDDAHVLAGAKSWDVVAFLLRSLPSGAQLAVGTRADPPLAPRPAAGGRRARGVPLRRSRLRPRRDRPAGRPARLRRSTRRRSRAARGHRGVGGRPAARLRRVVRASHRAVVAPPPRRSPGDRRLPHLGGHRAAACGDPGVPAAHLDPARAHAGACARS